MLPPSEATGGLVIVDSFSMRAGLRKPRSFARAALSALVVLSKRLYPGCPLAVWLSTDEEPFWRSIGFEARVQNGGLFVCTPKSAKVDEASQQSNNSTTPGTQRTELESEESNSDSEKNSIDGESGRKHCLYLGRCTSKVHKKDCPLEDGPGAGVCLRSEDGEVNALSGGLKSREADQVSLRALGPSALLFRKDELRLAKENLGKNCSLAGGCVLKVSGEIAVHMA